MENEMNDMNEKNGGTGKKERKSLFNIFDIVVIVLILGLGAVLFLTRNGDVSEAVVQTRPIHYTVELNGMINDTASLVKEGDELADRIKKYKLGKIEKIVSVGPTQTMATDLLKGEYKLLDIPKQQRVVVEVAADAVVTDTQISVDNGGVIIRVGASLSVKGPGYHANGVIISINREELE